MLARTADHAEKWHDGGGGVAAARTPSSSSDSDDDALPIRVVPGRVPRCVGRISDDDFETSSYEETSESSFSGDSGEEFIPLAFGYIKGNPRRRAGAPAPTKDPTDTSEEIGSRSSFSDATPLEVFFHHANANRNCGHIARNVERDEITLSLSSFDDDSSVVSDTLPMKFERSKKMRGVGKVYIPTYEVSDSESAISLVDDDEAPLNAQLIHTLVKRLCNPLDEVTLEAFDYLDFNDANFEEVLKPLKQIKACLERRASYPMTQSEEVEKEIRAAIQSLPSQKAIAVKVLKVKSRPFLSAQPTYRLYRGGESGPQNTEVLPGLVARLKNSKEEVLLSEFEKVDWMDRNFEPVLLPLRQLRAYMEAKEVIEAKLTEGKMTGATVLDDKIKTAVLSLPADEEMAVKVKSIASRSMPRELPNSEAIRELIKQLRDPEQHVQARAFEVVDWNDVQFSRELETLMQIRAFMEAKECTQKKAGENVMGSTRALDDKIRTVTMSLPAEKEMAAKVQAVKSRQLKATSGQNGVRLGGESSPEKVGKAKDATVSKPHSYSMPRGATNGEEILGLIKQLKDPEAQVPLCAFEELEWNDRNFARELEPLLQIRVYMEAKEALKKVPGSKNMSSSSALDNRIKTAILSLPSEKAVAVKIQMLKGRDMAPVADGAKPLMAKVGKLSAPSGTVRKMKDSILLSGQEKKKSKEGKLSASTSQVMQVGAKIISSRDPKYKAKESNALSEPTKIRRRRCSLGNRSVSFLKVEDPTPEEIVDQDQLLAETSGPKALQDEARPPPATATPRDASRVPSRPKKGLERRPRKHRLGNSAVSFNDLPNEEAGTIIEEDENSAMPKRKLHRRRAAHKLNRNLSISSLPDLEAGEVEEVPVLPDKPASREAATAVTATVAKPVVKPHGLKKKRRVRVNNNRSCSFSDIVIDEAVEVPDSNAGALKGVVEGPEVAKVTHRLVRRRRPDEEGRIPNQLKNTPKPEKEGGAEAGLAARVNPPSRGKGRRANVPRSRGANTSMVEDEANGEISELQGDGQRLLTPPEKLTCAPEKVTATRTRNQEMLAAARASKAGQKSSAMSSTPRRRRQRLHASKELNFSAVLDDVPGEIVEDERDIAVDAAPVGSLAPTMRRSLHSSGGSRVLPLLRSGSSRGSMRHTDRPNSSIRSSADWKNRARLPPNAEPSAMPDATEMPQLLPPQSVRRSTEPTLRATKPSVKSVKGDVHIPALRASQ
ncbi:hypothetical protein ABL78_4119 [Leptomonas seymouri]|uniref:Uncharacterized protein n=1 Tax=Leptomonas seymouri TaxID=5684 RepID=A0A0N1IKI1_LEPSE|nr:hypothetical protein ABL78_4119 [Leptomonas seymouri]|eukprot:KPI86795.1 hypothetical protein ABL78_4119 [Leptomonas seymouri]